MSSSSAQNNATLIDLEPDLVSLLSSIPKLIVDPPSLYIDLEGINLGRHGSISILSLHIAPMNKTYLIDIHTLGNAAFSTTDENGTSLKTILESATIPKVVFDIRNDSAALFNRFQVSVAGIKDLQLMELGCRAGSKAFVSSLAKCIEKQSPISAATKAEWRLAKERGRRLFAPEKGGRYEVFNERPLSPEIIQYCKQDVELLPGLYKVYNTKLRQRGEAFWRVHIRGETNNRIKLSQGPRCDGKSKSHTLGWDDHTIEEAMDSWNDDIMMEAGIGEWELDENDEWVKTPADNFEDFFDQLREHEDDDHYHEYSEDWYQDTARDCIGWEEDMIKNGESF